MYVSEALVVWRAGLRQSMSATAGFESMHGIIMFWNGSGERRCVGGLS